MKKNSYVNKQMLLTGAAIAFLGMTNTGVQAAPLNQYSADLAQITATVD